MTDHNLAVIILAAGAGTRMRSKLPKVLHELAGVPMIGHVVNTAAQLGAAQTVAVLRHEREQVGAVIRQVNSNVVVAVQDEIPGTGRAAEIGLQSLAGAYPGDVLVVSGDVPLLDANTLQEFVARHRESGAVASVLTASYDDPTGFGRIIRDGQGNLTEIVEHKDATDEQRLIGEVNSGSYLFRADALRLALTQVGRDNVQGEKYLTDVIRLIRDAGGVVVAHAVRDNWLVAGVNDRVQLSEVSRELNRRIIRGWQRAGVTVIDPDTTWIDVSATLDEDVTIFPGTQIKGTSVVHRDAVIGSDTTLLDCEVGAGARVLKTHAVSARIGAGAEVGPFSYLRPGTVLGADGKIGTFVETKNATIGAGTKVPHLSYVGDAEIGEQTNIGAGTIFANYDGVKKHRSRIGSHARTGSQNVFVSPIEIGDGAYTGAGTIVRKDVAAGALALSFAPQKNSDGWVMDNRPGTAAAEAAEAAQDKAE